MSFVVVQVICKTLRCADVMDHSGSGMFVVMLIEIILPVNGLCFL